ncbi:GNAT family N-acetyltransferase [Solihabitans fulvus]|uniref:GNAT family N-acetyltransferase n=1 Tax=Solihabitans fulvus TaxID=1892852 RepID=A0A5B2XN94_9PSEU|nr:GNAT family N-acetyltransferase [Solihabitans fulvus]KAA2264292.1 GNAT family N-acetyltransferase [Solihabitans fulvus]
MLFRPTVESDLDRVLTCTVTEPISWAKPDRYRINLADGGYRPERTWIAEDGDRILARAVWWGFPDEEHPRALDCVYVHESVTDRAGLAAELLDAAHRAFRERGVPELPAFHIFLPNGWREDPAVAAAVDWRREIAARVGLTDELERLRFEWTPEVGVPAASDRLEFRAEPDDEVMVSVFRRIAVGSLDHATRRELATIDAERQARDDMGIYLSMPGERDWWRLAYTPDGRLAGLAIPSANGSGPVVGYLGVLPEFRGRGYVDDLLGEITRSLAEGGAERIAADTDTTNLPMAAAFERAGYRNFAVRLVLSESVEALPDEVLSESAE